MLLLRSEVIMLSRVPASSVIIFVNSRNGLQLGGELLISYQTLLNKTQVFNTGIIVCSLFLMLFMFSRQWPKGGLRLYQSSGALVDSQVLMVYRCGKYRASDWGCCVS
ncbi:putative diacylglycerol kinase (ATP) [Helianthus debilis subsp. tardiflorus]